MKPKNAKITSLLELSYQDLADITGRSYGNIANTINRKTPDWLKVALHIKSNADTKIQSLELIVNQLQEDKKELIRLLKEMEE